MAILQNTMINGTLTVSGNVIVNSEGLISENEELIELFNSLTDDGSQPISE